VTDSAEVAKAVAANLRALRARRNWTLDQLAQRAKVSKGALVALEGDRGNPNLATLVRLSDAFGVALSDLVDTEPSAALRLVGAEEATVLWRGPSGGVGRLLLSTDPPGPVELWRWRLEPGEGKQSDAHPEGTQEAALVLSGELTLDAAEQTTLVPAGSAVCYPGNAAHAYRNPGPTPTEFVLVIKVP
jgi:transcriptional regulator with XRE-family HTH domain